MTSAREREAELMQMTATTLISSGYTVLIQPSQNDLPAELKGFRPDGIAIGKKPYLAIEITSEGGLARTEKVKEALKDNPDWELYVVLDRGKSSEPLRGETPETIESVLDAGSKLSDQDPRAALLMCWAALEAFARLLDPSNFGRPQTPSRVVEQLASRAYIAPSEANFLREQIKKRNEFIHGQLSTVVAKAEIDKFSEILRDLIGTYRKEAARNNKATP
jgi:hypothetical protein